METLEFIMAITVTLWVLASFIYPMYMFIKKNCPIWGCLFCLVIIAMNSSSPSGELGAWSGKTIRDYFIQEEAND